MITRPRAAAVIVVALAASALGCRSEPTGGRPAADPARLLAVPAPDLSRADAAVVDQISAAQNRVERLADSATADAAELGEAYGSLGLVHLTYGFAEAAEAAFRNAGALQPADYRWPYLLGYLHQTQGQLDAAAAALTRVLEVRPDDLPARIRLGTVLVELGRHEQAQPHFERAAELDPDSAAALNGLGRVAAARGDPAAAVRYFERALELQPRASSIRHALGLAYRNVGDLERARRNLDLGGDALVLFPDPLVNPVAELGRSAELFRIRGGQAFDEKRFDHAAEYYRRALELEPTDFSTHKGLGFCLEKLGDVEGAIAQLDEALRLGTTGDPARDRRERAEVLRIRGGLEVREGQDARAIATFRQALELDPQRLEVHYKLANALARGGRFEEAVGHYDRVLAERPDDAVTRVKRATALINLGRVPAALADFEAAVRAAPDDPQPRLRYAEALEHLGRAAAAAEQRAQAAALGGGADSRGRVLAATALRRLRAGELEGAAAAYRELLELDPALADARCELASILGHLGRYEEALAEFRRVIEEVPWHARARRGEVTALLLEGRYVEARERLQEGLQALPRDRALAHGLARLLAIAPVSGARQGDRALGLAHQVHEVSPGLPTAETLAMAYAEAGRFPEAVALQQRLLDEAVGSGDRERAARLRERLEAFELKRPWRARHVEEILAALAPPGGAATGG